MPEQQIGDPDGSVGRIRNLAEAQRDGRVFANELYKRNRKQYDMQGIGIPELISEFTARDLDQPGRTAAEIRSDWARGDQHQQAVTGRTVANFDDKAARQAKVFDNRQLELQAQKRGVPVHHLPYLDAINSASTPEEMAAAQMNYAVSTGNHAMAEELSPNFNTAMETGADRSIAAGVEAATDRRQTLALADRQADRTAQADMTRAEIEGRGNVAAAGNTAARERDTALDGRQAAEHKHAGEEGDKKRIAETDAATAAAKRETDATTAATTVAAAADPYKRLQEMRAEMAEKPYRDRMSSLSHMYRVTNGGEDGAANPQAEAAWMSSQGQQWASDAANDIMDPEGGLRDGNLDYLRAWTSHFHVGLGANPSDKAFWAGWKMQLGVPDSRESRKLFHMTTGIHAPAW